MTSAGKTQPVVLITGCSEGGIGYELARAFKDASCNVFASARRVETMDKLKEIGINLLELDVTSEESINLAVAELLQKAGRIDILVNNAGVLCPGPIAEIPIADMRSTFETNLFGVVALIQAVFPHMVNQGSGRIVNVGSIVGYISTPWNATYCATKAALHSLTDALRLELKPFGISAVLIAPGAIRSNIARNSLKPLAARKWRLYGSYSKKIEERANSSQINSTPTDVFARKIVQISLKKNAPAHFTYGTLSGVFSFMRWLPVGLIDRLIGKKFGIIGYDGNLLKQ